MTNLIPDLQLSGNGQCFPLFVYEKSDANTLFEQEGIKKRFAISDRTLEKYIKAFGNKVNYEEIFFYVYGLLHHHEYQTKYQIELGKSLPRIPKVTAFHEIAKIGKKLSDLHVNYETGELFNFSNGIDLSNLPNTQIKKIRYSRNGKNVDKSRIICNDSFDLTGIPEEAHKYDLYGRSALDWVIDRYEYTMDIKSGIIQDPNLWSNEQNYVLKLLSRVTNLSLVTVELLSKMPKLEDIEK
jgi:predicted helicase